MHLPGPVRAVVGLFATAAEEAKNLPDRAIELPMLAVSTAMQMSLRAQQRYARLAARGDEVLNRRPPSDEPPPWATFDEPVSLDTLLAGGAPAATENGAEAPAPEVEKAAGPRKAPAKKAVPASEKSAPAKKSSARGKSVSRPRHTAPSRFDAVDDE